MKKYVMGVDGGGTKSHIAVFDDEGNRIAFKTWGTLNHECMKGSFPQLEREMSELLSGVMKEIDITHEELAFSVFGIAGVDTRKQNLIVSEMLRRLGFKDFVLCNDAYLGIAAASPDGTGICAINGTGCTVSGINAAGKMLQIGGVGAVSEDLGGGEQMGYAVIGRAYRSMFRSGEPTVLADLLLDELKIKDKYDFVEAFTEKRENGEINVGKINRLLFEAVSLGDKAAYELARKIAENYAGAVTSMLAELSFPYDKEIRVVFAGSVFVKAEHPFLLDETKRLIMKKNNGRRFKFTLLEKPPVTGAAVWALNRAGMDKLAVIRAYNQF